MGRVVTIAVWLAWATASLAQSGLYDWSNAAPLSPAYPGILFTDIVTNVPYSTTHVRCLRMDTTTPGMRFYTTGRGSNWVDGATETPPAQYAETFISGLQSSSFKVRAAINGDAFSPVGLADSKDLRGYNVSEGVKVSSADASAVTFVVDKSLNRSIITTSSSAEPDTNDVHVAVSGFWYCLRDGSETGDSVTLSSRTGLGLSQDARYVYFVVYSGSIYALGTWLKHFGAYNGINMDGGGSSQMAWWNPSTKIAESLKSVPSGRLVGNHIGVYYTQWPAMRVLGNGVVIPDGTLSWSAVNGTDIGDTYEGGAGIVRTFTIRNDGSAPLELSGTPAVTVSGVNPADFTVTQQPTALTLASNETTTFQVTFAPTAWDFPFRKATLTIVNNDPDAVPYDFVVHGDVLDPVAPVANFTATPTRGTAPLTVVFTDLTTGGPLTNWEWDFDTDGVVDSTQQHPTNVFAAGDYSVRLVVSNALGVSTNTQVDLITVVPPTVPIADFSAMPTYGVEPMAVVFTDLTIGGTPTSWAWDFDADGVVDSTQRNPTNIFSAGSYSVQLTVSNALGSSTEIKADYVYVETLQDAWIIYYGLSPDDDDEDGDGMSNADEFRAGFDPYDDTSYLHVLGIELAGDDVNVVYLGANGDTSYGGPAVFTNVLEVSPAPGAGGFQSAGVTSVLSGGTGSGVVTNMIDYGGATNGPVRFYRVRVLTP